MDLAFLQPVCVCFGPGGRRDVRGQGRLRIVVGVEAASRVLRMGALTMATGVPVAIAAGAPRSAIRPSVLISSSCLARRPTNQVRLPAIDEPGRAPG
jgi:hypothetical protein